MVITSVANSDGFGCVDCGGPAKPIAAGRVSGTMGPRSAALDWALAGGQALT